MDLVSRLKQYLDSLQISVTQFADECGIPRPTASQLLAGRNKKVSDEIIGKIHQCYPNLNVIWLMFGEGDMLTTGNIKTSEPQNPGFFGFPDTQNTENKDIATAQSQPEIVRENFPEKMTSPKKLVSWDRKPYIPSAPSTGKFRFTDPESPSKTTSTFAFEAPSRPIENSQPQSRPEHSGDSNTPITLTPDKGKRVVGIVVYYDDSTFESFIPDSEHSTPFIR